MEARNGVYSKYDLEAARILADFVPESVFDAHMHHRSGRKPGEADDFAQYLQDFAPLFGNRKLYANMLAFPVAGMSDPETGKATEKVAESTQVLKEQLEKHPELVAEVIVSPGDTPEQIEARMVAAGGSRVIGLKPYHLLAARQPTFQADICEYLPESAWEVAEKHGLSITLHLVKDRSLADPQNLSYTKEHARRYPGATLILAHCARSFASWTVMETIGEITPFDNIRYDFSGICESPQMFMILKKAGVEKCMWGSDWDISTLAGKCISIADSFYWIGERDLAAFQGNTEFHSWLVGTENLMAVRQAAQMLELSPRQLEQFFYENARSLFLGK